MRLTMPSGMPTKNPKSFAHSVSRAATAWASSISTTLLSFVSSRSTERTSSRMVPVAGGGVAVCVAAVAAGALVVVCGCCAKTLIDSAAASRSTTGRCTMRGSLHVPARLCFLRQEHGQHDVAGGCGHAGGAGHARDGAELRVELGGLTFHDVALQRGGGLRRQAIVAGQRAADGLPPRCTLRAAATAMI